MLKIVLPLIKTTYLLNGNSLAKEDLSLNRYITDEHFKEWNNKTTKYIHTNNSNQALFKL